MSQLAALAVRGPSQINLPAIEQAAQNAAMLDLQLQQKRSSNQVDLAKDRNELARQSALSNYHTKAAAGDDNALDELRGFPDEYKNVATMFDNMEPDDWHAAQIRATAFGEAAKSVMSLPAGSPQQKKLWDQRLGELMAAGHIDKGQHDAMVSAGPSEDILNEAMTTEEFVKAYAGRKARQGSGGSALEKARIEDIGADNARADKLANAKIEKGGTKKTSALEQLKVRGELDKLIDNKRKALGLSEEDLLMGGKGDNMAEADPAETELYAKRNSALAEFDKYRTEMETKYLDAQEPDGAGDPAADAGDGSAKAPFRPKTRAEAEALPSGAYFLTPDGKLIRKK